jgi:hypothetical protein
MQGRKEITPKMLYQVHLDGKQKKQKISNKFILGFVEGHISHRKFTEVIFQ